MQEIGKFNKYTNVIPYNMKKYMAFIIDKNLIFIDSFQFMNKSLSDLADDLPKDSFYQTKKEYGTENLELITRKGIYPYDYMDDFNKLKDEGLPSVERFYSKLTSKNISNCDYKHAKNVGKKFECKIIGAYHDLYLKSDVLILADVFENFSKKW